MSRRKSGCERRKSGGKKADLGGRVDDSDGTIISADSLGQVTFWDGKSLAQIKSFKAHAADALCLVISPVSRGNESFV